MIWHETREKTKIAECLPMKSESSQKKVMSRQELRQMGVTEETELVMVLRREILLSKLYGEIV